ncbi:MAG: hypothetical protein ACOYKM_09735 [Caulobacterales bacterium]|jgi:hypothetical protein
MRYSLVLALCTFASACVTYSQAPPNFELTWVKHNVAFEQFVADVDACNATAQAAGQAVEPRRGDPTNDLAAPILAWRWLAHGADVDTAMSEAYEACFVPRGYSLAYVSETDARAFNDIRVAPLPADASLEWRRSQQRDAQLRLLHQLAVAEPPSRARIETRLQQRPLLSSVAQPGV